MIGVQKNDHTEKENGNLPQTWFIRPLAQHLRCPVVDFILSTVRPNRHACSVDYSVLNRARYEHKN